MSMEENGNQNLATFCRNGCGFYAAQAFDGMCSKCYKDLDQNTSAMTSVQSSAAAILEAAAASGGGGGNGDVGIDVVAAALGKTSLGEMDVNPAGSEKFLDTMEVAATGSCPELETASPTMTTRARSGSDCEDSVRLGAKVEGADVSPAVGDKSKKQRKNRCMQCRKNVGLTGFTCHCGLLFCSLHRYSDTHGCSFDFRQKGKEEIRKNNPIVRGDRVHRI